MSVGVAGRYQCLQGAAGALDEGAAANRAQDVAADCSRAPAVAGEGGSLLSSHRHNQLPVDGGALGVVAAGDDSPVSPRLEPGVVAGPAAVSGRDGFGCELFSLRATGVVTARVVAASNTRAALEALAGEESPFVRTPKYRIETARRAWYRLGYRAPEGAGLAWLELGLGVYFLWATAFALSRENYYTVPFLTLFLWGYTYTGLLSLAQPYLEQFSFAGLTLRLRQWAQTL
jgi:hypothetical protein